MLSLDIFDKEAQEYKDTVESINTRTNRAINEVMPDIINLPNMYRIFGEDLMKILKRPNAQTVKIRNPKLTEGRVNEIMQSWSHSSEVLYYTVGPKFGYKHRGSDRHGSTRLVTHNYSEDNLFRKLHQCHIDGVKRATQREVVETFYKFREMFIANYKREILDGIPQFIDLKTNVPAYSFMELKDNRYRKFEFLTGKFTIPVTRIAITGNAENIDNLYNDSQNMFFNKYNITLYGYDMNGQSVLLGTISFRDKYNGMRHQTPNYINNQMPNAVFNPDYIYDVESIIKLPELRPYLIKINDFVRKSYKTYDYMKRKFTASIILNGMF